MTTAIILAGGLGTRLRNAVPDVPKPMAKVSERPFLEHLMDYWLAQGVNQFILSVGYQYQLITDHFGAEYRGATIRYAVENEPLGTGGGLLLAVQNLSNPVLVLNGDTFFAVDLQALRQFHVAKQSAWTFSLFRTDYVGRYMGMDVADNGRITALKSNATQPGRLANGGAYLLDPGVLNRTTFQTGDKFSLEDDLLPTLLNANVSFYGLECPGRFIDIGIPEDYFRAADILA